MSKTQADFMRLAGLVAPRETTTLSPQQEAQFQQWAKARGIADVNSPDAHYDYRGFWVNGGQQASANGHFPDTYKQHGHPTFSQESKYSSGPHDGGTWSGEQFTAPSPQDSLTMMDQMRRSVGDAPPRKLVTRRKSDPGLTGADLEQAKAEAELAAADKGYDTANAQHAWNRTGPLADAGASAAANLANITATRNPDTASRLMAALAQLRARLGGR